MPNIFARWGSQEPHSRAPRGPRRPRLTEQRAKALSAIASHIRAVLEDVETEDGIPYPQTYRDTLAEGAEYLEKLVGWKLAQSRNKRG